MIWQTCAASDPFQAMQTVKRKKRTSKRKKRTSASVVEMLLSLANYESVEGTEILNVLDLFARQWCSSCFRMHMHVI